MNTFAKQWIAVGNRELWQHEQWATYISLGFERLPELPTMDDSLSWLANRKPRLDENGELLGLGLENQEQLSSLLIESHSLSLALPESFISFMQQPKLQQRVPSCTACFLELSEHFIPLKQTNTYALRFMNDQQSCVMWYLYFEEGKCAGVIASAYFLEPDFFQEMYGEDDISYEDVQDELMYCADSFTSFLYRFYFENELWFAIQHDETLNKEQQLYIEEAHQKNQL